MVKYCKVNNVLKKKKYSSVYIKRANIWWEIAINGIWGALEHI